MFCRKCGRKIDDNANFCPYCREKTGVGDAKKIKQFNTENDTKQSKKKRRHPKKGKKPKWAVIIAAVLVIVIGGITFWKMADNKNDIGFENVSMSREEILSATTQYDNGDWLYQPKKENIAFDEEEKRIYYNNLLTVFLKSKLSSKDEERLANLVHGAIVGYIDGNISILQIMVDETNFSTLQHYSDILMETEPVFYAAASIPIMTSEEKTKKEDLLWNGDKDIGNEESPNGADWWAEAIGAYTAWKYSDLVQPVTVGIIDNGFELNHRDLCDRNGNSIITMLNENSVDKKADSPEHGTHVTGIIAAQNNTFGIRGIADRATILVADKYPIKGQEKTEEESNSSPEFVYEHMKEMIEMAKSENSALVINNSWGLSKKIIDILEELGYKIKNQDQRTVYQNLEISSAKYAIEVVECLRLNYGDRFIIVQSAGNGIDELGVGYNARNNGWFSGITEATYKEEMQELRKNDPKMAEAFLSYEDIKAHIMIVGAVENALENNMYKMTGFSNYGYSVDICAPGKHIYSTVLNNKYGYLDGTSMAAPIVSGSAAYLWSLRPDLTASEVKDALIKYADKAVGVTGEDKGNIYPMVNIGRAVKNMAVGTISGTVTDSETGEALSDVTCIVASEFNGEKGSISMQNNDDGTFDVTSLGKCKVILQREGYVSVQMEIEVGINDRISAGNISMRKKSETEKLDLSTYVKNVLIPQYGKCNTGKFECAYVVNSNGGVAVDSVHSEKGILNWKVDDYDGDGTEELLVLLLDNQAKIQGDSIDRNSISLQMYAEKDGKIELKDTYDGLCPVLGYADEENDGIFLKESNQKIYICGSTWNTFKNYVSGMVVQSFIITYENDKFAVQAGQTESISGSDFSECADTAAKMTDVLSEIGLEKEAEQLSIPAFRFNDEVDQTLLRITGENKGFRTEYYTSNNADDLGKVELTLACGELEKENEAGTAEGSITNDMLDGVWLQRDVSDAMQFIFSSDENSLCYYATINNGTVYTTKYSLENDELKVNVVNLDGDDVTTLYFDLTYSEEENMKILTITHSDKDDDIDTSALYGFDDLMDGTYVQMKESWVKKQLNVPEDLDVNVIHKEAYYWDAAQIYVIYYAILKDDDYIASASVDALTGELAKDIMKYQN